ncbi:hypothetical protein H4R21_001897 [Coemansia helicoidea]|uniref:Uncharacterized protein n=1 Tax=Coemansia helicoidea TaxID=1286919 RepID=A0ACC1L9W0_9FUNG|nr:hypothetical protein H4R21_001897 [Coemansia helicoidea]
MLKTVFGYMAAGDAGSDPGQQCGLPLGRLRALQPLTAVCRSWRRATLPLFYQSVVCCIREAPTAGPATSKAQDSVPNHAWSTNLGLIADGGFERYARQLAISMVGDVAPDLAATALAAEGFGSQRWQRIERLRVAHWHGETRRSPTYSAESLARLNSFLLHALPGLTSVRYVSPDDRGRYCEFPLDGLLASTLSRLTEISIATGLIPDMGSTAFLPALTSLTLRSPMLAGAQHLPMVCAESLETLHIGFTSADSIWGRFYAASGAGELCFGSLKTLVLEYREPPDVKARLARPAKSVVGLYEDCYSEVSECSSTYSDGKQHGLWVDEAAGGEEGDGDSEDLDNETLIDPTSPTRVLFCKRPAAASPTWPAFPALRSLSVCKYPDEIGHVLRQFAVDRIPNISIRDVRAGWAGLRPTTAARLSSLRVHIATRGLAFKREEHRYQAWVNRLFSVSSPMAGLHLAAPTAMPITLPDVVGLVQLSSLSLSFRVDLGSIPNLLSRLPRLQRLAMHVHTWSSWSQRNHGILGRGDYELLAVVPPLSRSLTSLVAYVGPESDEDPAGVERELAWLLARAPTLRSFKTEKDTRDAVARHIDDILASTSARCVQHLAHVRMDVWRY